MKEALKAYRLMNTVSRVNHSPNRAYVRLPDNVDAVPKSLSSTSHTSSTSTSTSTSKPTVKTSSNDHHSTASTSTRPFTLQRQSAVTTSYSASPPKVVNGSSKSAPAQLASVALSNDSTSEASLVQNDHHFPTNHKRLLRGISRATDNVTLVCKVRHELAGELIDDPYDDSSSGDLSNLDLPKSTFTLPDLSLYSPDFRHFLERDLIEQSTLSSLRAAKRLNWWHDRLDRPIAQPLYPLATTGDGNCLLHAASLGMFGFHDRLLTLRKALHRFMLRHAELDSPLYRRWRYQCSLQHRQAGLVLCDDEWLNDWRCLLKMASSEPRVRGSIVGTPFSPSVNGSTGDARSMVTFNACCGGQPSTECYAKRPESHLGKGKGGGAISHVRAKLSDEPLPLTNHVYESLEEIHVLALAHVLRRPIIVIADTMLKDVTGEPFAPIPFGGIYLPLQCPAQDCARAPLCLTYDAAHFSALVPMDVESFADRAPQPPIAIPLVDCDGNLLPVQFDVEPGPTVNWNTVQNTNNIASQRNNKLNLLKTYLDLAYLNRDGSTASRNSDRVGEEASKNSLPRNKVRSPNETSHNTIDRKRGDYASSSAENEMPSKTPSSNGVQSSRSDTNSEAAKSVGRVVNQLNNLSRGFGTLRRSMSKRIRRNLATFGKRSSSKSLPKEDGSREIEVDGEFKSSESIDDDWPTDTVIAAYLHVETRPEYHEQMIRNYLHTARQRFLARQTDKTSPSDSNASRCGSAASSSGSSKSALIAGSNSPSDEQSGPSNVRDDATNDSFVMPCVNTGCKNYGTGSTSYLCNTCYYNQQKEMLELKCTESIRVQM